MEELGGEVSLASLEQERILSIIEQLDGVAKSLMGEKLELTGDLGIERLYSLLNPPTSLQISLFTLQLELMRKNQALAELKRTMTVVGLKTEKLQADTLQVKTLHETLGTSLTEAEAEVNVTCLEELQHAARSYEREIKAERAVSNSLNGLMGIYEGGKLDMAMDRVRALMEDVSRLKKDLHFSHVLPPNLREAKAALQGRKDHLSNLLSRIQDLTSASP